MGEFHLHFTKINNYPQVIEATVAWIFSSFFNLAAYRLWTTCIYTIMSHTVDTNDATQSISHHNHIQTSWLHGTETRLSIIPVNASVTHMVLALSQIIG